MNETPLLCASAEREWLAMRDGRMARAIALLGPIQRHCHPDLFSGLVHAITGQQISSRAHESIWSRLKTLLGEVSPETLLSQDAGSLRGCGISGRKAEYLLALAQEFASGRMQAHALRQMDDNALAAALGKLRGIGPWTVEMLLIFTFRRKNVISFADLAIRRGLALLHGLDSLDSKTCQYFRDLYSPCCTAASLYLWAIAAHKTWPARAAISADA